MPAALCWYAQEAVDKKALFDVLTKRTVGILTILIAAGYCRSCAKAYGGTWPNQSSYGS